MSLVEFDYRQHVRDGGKLTLQEFKQRRKEKYKRRGLELMNLERELAKEAKRLRKEQPDG